MIAFGHHFAFEFKTGLRNPTAMLMYYLFPLGFYALMGVVMIQINPGFGDSLVPAMVIVAVMAGTILGFPGQLADSREAGIFRSFKVNGVPALSIITVPLIAAVFHVVIASAVITATAAPFFHVALPVDWPGFALVLLVAALAFGALAALIGVIATGSRSIVLWSQLVFLPSMLIGGLMIDVGLLPAGVRRFSGLLPSTYAMEAFLGRAYHRQTVLDPTVSLLVLASGAVVAFGLALLLFGWDRQNQTRRLSPLLAVLVLVPYLVGVVVA